MSTGQWVAVGLWLTFTGLFVGLFLMGMMRTSAKPWPKRTDILTDEERAQWEQIERHWQ